MKLETSFDDVIEELESRLPKSDIQRCQETAQLSAYYLENVTYRGAYITAMLQKLNSNTRGNYDRTN